MMSKLSANQKKIWRIIIIALFLLLISSFFVTKIIYDASFMRYDPKKFIAVATDISDGTVEQLHNLRKQETFYTGITPLQGYRYSMKNTDTIVVIAPGFHASTDDYLLPIQNFLNCGWDVFIFDTTGSCTSAGESAVGFSQELLDLDAALDYIEEKYSYQDIFLFGHSRGGYAVCGMLNSNHTITAAVTISGINSAMEAIIAPAEQYIGAFAYTNYPMLWFYQTLLFGPEVVNLDAAKELSHTEVPTLVIQGSNDTIAKPNENSIYAHRAEITSSKVQFLYCDVPGKNGHTDLMYENTHQVNQSLMQDVNQFYKKYANVSNDVR